ncbi:MAG: hypothetical protein QNL04_10960 [SAR324 cluster bacterium]|nr:hypothetical protein [SAR324 cluster bacterium]
MSTYKIAYGTAEVISDSVVLMTPAEGIEVTLEIFQELLALLKKLYPNGVKVVVDMRSQYSVSTESMLAAVKQPHFLAVAFVVYREHTIVAAETLKMMFGDKQTEIFLGDDGVELAKKWLNQL